MLEYRNPAMNRDTTKRLLKVAVSLFSLGLRNAIERGLGYLGVELPGTFTVLYYHDIPSRQEFRKQMVELRKVARPVPADFSEAVEPGKRYVALTFDDALESVSRNALPILIEEEIPCTIFVPSKYVGTLPGWEIDRSDSAYNQRVMTGEEIRSLPRELVSIGSHTHSHVRLSGLENGEMEAELRDSKAILEGIMGVSVDSLAFPHGDFDERVLEVAKALGYAKAYSTVPDFSRRFARPFLRGRVKVLSAEWDVEFRLKIRGAYEWTRITRTLFR